MPKPLGRGLLGNTPGALKPRSRKQLARQATRLTRRIYKPALTDLRQQEKKTNALAEKRKSDNQYYLDWLGSQTAQLKAHASAADAQLLETQNQIQQSSQQAMQGLRDQLVEAGNQNAGNVSNAAQATANDITPEAQRASDLVANERTRTTQQIGSNRKSVNENEAANFALMAASEARRQSDQFNALKDIANARQKTKLERAAKTSEEVARLLDQEIAKAQSRVDMRAQAAQLGLSLKEFKLRKKEFGFNKKLQMGELRETIRSNKADERQARRDSRADRRNDARDDARAEQEMNQDRNEGRQERRQERQQLQRSVKRTVNNGISTIAADESLQRLLSTNPNKAVRKLVKKGFEPIFARAAADLVGHGKVRPPTAKNLRNLGFHVPDSWLGR